MLKKEKQRNGLVSSSTTSNTAINKSKHVSERNPGQSVSVSRSSSGKSNIPDDVSIFIVTFFVCVVFSLSFGNQNLIDLESMGGSYFL